jgi:integrase/recombinase XerC
MPRQPKPWYWKARGAWYVQIKGKQVRLHERKAEADREFYRLMAAEGRLESRQAQRMTVADACEAMIASVQYRRPATIRVYVEKLGAFAEAFGTRRLDSIQPAEVIQWAGSYEGSGRLGRPLSESTRAVYFRFVKQLYRWCRDTGLVGVDPFARVPNPWRVQKRNEPMGEDEYEKIMMMRLSTQFKEIVEFVWRTGIRPGELAILTAKHLDSRLPIARFQPTEHKTGTRTGLQREVYFPADLWGRLKAKAEVHRQGPLFRKANGTPWTSREISNTFGRVRRRHGLRCVLYQARHRWATTLLDSGIPAARVAKMAGHVRPDVLLTTYYHPEAEQMSADIDAMGEDEAALARKIAEMQEAREAARREALRKCKMMSERRRRARLKALRDAASGT